LRYVRHESITPLFLNPFARRGWMVNFTPREALLPRKNTGNTVNRRTYSRSGRFAEKKNFLLILGFEPRTVPPNTAVTIMTELLRLLEGVRGQFYAPAALYHRERPGTHCTGSWVGPRAGLDLGEKSCPHRDSIPATSSP
jgi:hypothetical protein